MYIQALPQDQLRQNHIYPGGVAPPAFPSLRECPQSTSQVEIDDGLQTETAGLVSMAVVLLGGLCCTTPLNVMA